MNLTDRVYVTVTGVFDSVLTQLTLPTKTVFDRLLSPFRIVN